MSSVEPQRAPSIFGMYQRAKQAEESEAAARIDLQVAIKTVKVQRSRIGGLESVIAMALREIDAGEFAIARTILADAVKTIGVA